MLSAAMCTRSLNALLFVVEARSAFVDKGNSWDKRADPRNCNRGDVRVCVLAANRVDGLYISDTGRRLCTYVRLP